MYVLCCPELVREESSNTLIQHHIIVLCPSNRNNKSNIKFPETFLAATVIFTKDIIAFLCLYYFYAVSKFLLWRIGNYSVRTMRLGSA